MIKVIYIEKSEMMDLRELFEMQKGLDEHIAEKHELKADSLISRKVLALLVELGELANETRCFKFWSVKGASQKEVILEEFVDGVHFILSLGLDCGFERDVQVEELALVEENVTNQFLSMYETVHRFSAERSIDAYRSMLESYFVLGKMLGFTSEEIKEAYISKNEVNYKRQKEGY
jgi:dimeric dUTPase (all-alpha-NTP-PPase superfamily)